MPVEGGQDEPGVTLDEPEGFRGLQGNAVDVRLERVEAGGHCGLRARPDLAERLANREGDASVAIKKPRQSRGRTGDVGDFGEAWQLRRSRLLHLDGGVGLDDANDTLDMLVRRQAQRVQSVARGTSDIGVAIFEPCEDDRSRGRYHRSLIPRAISILLLPDVAEGMERRRAYRGRPASCRS